MSREDDPLDVLFLPYYDDNPYQRELSSALEERDMTIRTGDHEAPFPILQSVCANRPDVLHLHWAHSIFVMHSKVVTLVLGMRLLFEVLICKILGIPIVWTVHNTLDHERRHPRIELTVRQLVARYCDALITHGDTARREIVETYDIPVEDASQVAVIPHGNYIGSYPDEVSQTEARETLSLPSDATIFLHFGNIRPYKGVDRLVETFGKLDMPESRLLIAGRSPTNADDRAALLDACNDTDHVDTVFGYIPDDEVQHYFAAADAVVLPFERVLTSGSVVLAMSFGCPVVAPRMGCLPDTLAEANDLLYDPANPTGLPRQMRRVCEEEISSIGVKNRKQAARNDWGTVADRTRTVYLAAKNGDQEVAEVVAENAKGEATNVDVAVGKVS